MPRYAREQRLLQAMCMHLAALSSKTVAFTQSHWTLIDLPVKHVLRDTVACICDPQKHKLCIQLHVYVALM